MAVLAEADLTGRRRAHRGRPARASARPPAIFEDLKPGDYVVHYQHGVGRYEGMVKRTIGGVERDYLLLEYKGGDKLYVPSDQIDTVRQYVGGEAPALHRLGGADFEQGQEPGPLGRAGDRAGAGGALPEARSTPPGFAFPPDTPWQREMEEAFPYVETPDQIKAIDDVKDDMERAHPDGPARLRRRRVRQDRGGRPRRVQGHPGRQAGGGARAHHPARAAARQHLRRSLPRLPDPRRGAVRASSARRRRGR